MMYTNMRVSVTPEFSLDEGSSFAGGLGVLEGDKFYAAARLGMEYTVITPFYSRGYGDYDFNRGMAVPVDSPYPPEFLAALKEKTGSVTIGGREVATAYRIFTKGKAKAVFIDTVSPPWARRLNEHLYEHTDTDLSFNRYVLLAEGAVDYLSRYEKGVEGIDMQEAYTTLLAISPNLHKLGSPRLRFVIHTPGPWGHPSFPARNFKAQYGFDFLYEKVYLTDLGLATAEKVFCVSKKHHEITAKVMPHFADKIGYVTNGIEIPRWRDARLATMGRKEFSAFKEKKRRELLRHIGIRSNGMVLAWNRRIVTYKRPDFMQRFIEENGDDDLVFILAGKAHPQDLVNREIMEQFRALADRRKNVYYTPSYNIELSKKIVSGADLMVFTPFSGWESSGTSFMKGMANGTPPITSRDGSVVEFVRDGYNGWLFGNDLRDLVQFDSKEGIEISRKDYAEFSTKLLKVIEMWRNRREEFVDVALNSMNTPGFDMDRVMKAYFPDGLKKNA